MSSNENWREEAEGILEEIKRVKHELSYAVAEEQEVASLVDSLTTELEDLQNLYADLIPDDGSDSSSGGLDDF